MISFSEISVRKTLVILLIVVSGIYIFSLFRATVNGDEAALAEQSYYLNKVGFVKSPIMDGMGIGWENRQYHYHKLFVATGAAVFNFFGLSLYLLRTINYLFFILASVLIGLYIKNQGLVFGKNATLICILILLFNFTLLQAGMIYRPETMVMTLGFVSFYFLSRGLDQNKQIFFYLAAIFAGLSAFSHLNGLSFIFAGFVLLAIKRKYLHAVGFGFTSTIFGMLYFYDLNTIAELKMFWEQFTADPNLSKDDFRFFTPLFKIINEHLRFFWNLNIATFSILMLTSVITFFKSIKQKQFNLFVYFLALIIGLASVSHGKTLKYGLLYFPYIALIITFALSHLEELNSTKKKILIGILAIFLLVNSFSTIKNCITYRDSIGRTKMICSFLPQNNVNIQATECYYFNASKFFNIHSFLAFELYYEKYLKTKPTAVDFYDFAESHNNKYLILDKYTNVKATLTLLDFDKMQLGQSFCNYSVIKKGDDFAILELNSDDIKLKEIN